MRTCCRSLDFLEYGAFPEPGIAQLTKLTQLRTSCMPPVPLACLPRLRDLTLQDMHWDGVCLSSVAELTRLELSGTWVNFRIFPIENARQRLLAPKWTQTIAEFRDKIQLIYMFFMPEFDGQPTSGWPLAKS